MTTMAPAVSPLSLGAVMQVCVSLLLIVALIFAISWALRRVRFTARGTDGQFGVLGELAVGPRERIVLVRVGEAQVLVGVGAGGIVALSPLATPIQMTAVAGEPTFAARLRELLGRGGGPS